MTAVFGRDRELALTDGFLECAAGRFAVLLLEGEAGIGKTTIWREVAGRAKKQGFCVLDARPAEAETKLALSTVADLLESVPDEHFAALPGSQRRTLEVALLRAQPGSASLVRRTVAAAVRGILARLSRDRPLLVAIDDLQWLDFASASVLGFAIRRLTGDRIGWSFTRRVGEATRLTPGRLVQPESVTRIPIGPLNQAALHHVLMERLGQPISRSVLVRIQQGSRGNPFHALEIARELERLGGPRAGARLPIPDDLRTLVMRTLRRLPRPTRMELLAAAALSSPTTSLLDEGALGPAEEADLVRIDQDGAIAFTHPLFSSAVYGSASSARRREVHARFAQLVAEPEERARHLALAVRSPDDDVARSLEEGAALARARGAWESAAELLERAGSLTPPGEPDEARRRAIAAAEHHIHAGDRSRARKLLEEILAEPLARPLRADALRLLGEVGYHDENFFEAERLLTEALQYADDPRAAATIELDISYAHAYSWDHAGCAAHAGRALVWAEASGDGPLIAQALAHTVMYNYLCGRGVDWEALDRALALEDPDMLVMLQSRPAVIAALLRLYVGLQSQARERLRSICELASERGDESDLAFVLLWRSWLETRSGNLGAAAALVTEGLSVASLTGSQSMHAWLLAQRALVHACLGDAEETRRDCVDAAALVPRFGNTLAGIWVAASLAVLELSVGNAYAAWDACAQLTSFLEMEGITEPVPAFFLPDALEALIAVRQLDRAEVLIVAFEQRARALDRAWALATGGRCRALLLAVRGDPVGASAAVDEALAAHERIEMPLELARTLLVRGVIERRSRKRARAQQSFQRALQIFEQSGAKLWAEHAREQLSRVGLRRAPGRQLTATEQRVAELAAHGLTNREVAAALFVSPKTVEANLARIYRKLNIASRAELGARMARSVQL